MSSLFSVPVDRHGTYCTQWDFVQDRFGQADLLPLLSQIWILSPHR